jgi:hypothetical protein
MDVSLRRCRKLYSSRSSTSYSSVETAATPATPAPAAKVFVPAGVLTEGLRIRMMKNHS